MREPNWNSSVLFHQGEWTPGSHHRARVSVTQPLTGLEGRSSQVSEVDDCSCDFVSGVGIAEYRPESKTEVCDCAAEERQKILVTWNDTRRNFPTEGCLHELFEAQAARTPEAIALVHGEREMTYGELNRRANRLATHLHGLGVGPDVPVAICVEPGFEMLVGLLSVLKAGGAYVPVAPDLPLERLRFLLADTRAPFLLTEARRAVAWPELQARLVVIDTDQPEVSSAGESGPRPRVDADHLAYIIYTSGSTGVPKGVMVPHREICNTLHWRQFAFPLSPADRILQTFSFTFDASLWELFGPLLAGARLVLTERAVARDSATLVRLVASHGITAMQTIPSRLRLLLAERDLEGCRSLRYVLCGGESMPVELKEQFFSRLGAKLHNLYGPTETSLDATAWECRPGDCRVVPIGGPIANKRLYVLDEHLCPVPVGIPGELYVGGAGVARGYLGNTALTAARFLADPFSPEPGSRMYRTGDLCRWRDDGVLLFLGRVDEQIKMRGYRIEPGEIEASLCGHPDVREAAVVAREDLPGEQRLVAYLVASGTKTPGSEELRRYLRSRLPEYMVPSIFVRLPDLPRTGTGKLNRRALPAPALAVSAPSSPRGPLEQFVAHLFAEVLHYPAVGEQDDFFDLGGTSLQVALLIHQLEDRLGEYVYTVALYDAPTVAALARYLRANYPVAVLRLFGPDALEGTPLQQASPVNEAKVTVLRRLVRGLPPRSPADGKPKTANPQAVFVLSPPRSGSTLFRVLLGGHPALFAPPELQLLNFNTLRERRAAFDTERDRFWLDGTVRAIMEARSCDATEAARIMEDCERRGMTVQEFYGLMQGWLGGATFVDKTPTYALDPQTLRRAEEDFEKPLFIHLVRHPSPVISSFEEAKLHVFFPPFFTGAHSFSACELAELIWTISHQNILEFLGGIPAQRQHRVHFEQLVREPRQVMEGVAGFLGKPFHPAMIEPFQEGHKSRMTDGLHPLARMLGDVKFHQHKNIEAQAAERKKGRFPEQSLGEVTRHLACSLGYSIAQQAPTPETAQAGGAVPANGTAPTRRASPAITGLPVRGRCLVPLQPEGRQRPFFCVHPAGGTVFCYRPLARRLGQDQPLYAFASPGLSGKSEAESLENLAASYLAEMRTVQPRGPFRLGGWSLGGVIAFEMAQQLSDQGEEVELLALIDSDLPSPDHLPQPADQAAMLTEVLASYDVPVSAAWLRQLDEETRLRHLLDSTREKALWPRDFTTGQLADLLGRHGRIFQANVQAVQRYVPRSRVGRIVLFRPSDESVTAPLGPKVDWDTLASAVVTHTVSGDHNTMLREPHVEALAGLFQGYLQSEQHGKKGTHL